ncbi:MAG: calcium/sodium antiporter [Chitinophagaceae bacterium]|nr:calcium/sodium antiporter [Chitinophagaceae bacterium]MCW5927278.1 calcium/sodium antiporter [Chitinophagaceae bacterium]
MSPYLVFLIGLVVITIGADFLLKGAAKIASLLGIRPIIIGITVVSIGTSLPELAVGITAVSEGAEDIAIGNIAGTNLVNILLILGLSAALRPLPLQLKTIKLEMFVMVFSAFLLLALCLDGLLSIRDGILMLLIGVIYIFLTIKNSKKENASVQEEFIEEYHPSSRAEKKKTRIWIMHILFLAGGIAATIWGADLLVAGASSIARSLGLSDVVIGLTIVAIGTSAPELVTTILATIRDNRDIAVGNLIGSSITNILFILGTTCLFAPGGLHVNRGVLWFDLPLAALVAIACYPVFRSDQMVSRKEGIVFVLTYCVYLGAIVAFRA